MVRILQYRGVSWLSKAIRIFTRGDYSHSAVLNLANGEIIEAWSLGGVRRVSMKDHEHTSGTIVDVYEIAQDFNQDLFWKRLEMELGKAYDFRGVLSFPLRQEKQDPYKWFCSELVHQKLLDTGVMLLQAPSFKISPTVLSYSPLMQYVDTIELK